MLYKLIWVHNRMLLLSLYGVAVAWLVALSSHCAMYIFDNICPLAASETVMITNSVCLIHYLKGSHLCIIYVLSYLGSFFISHIPKIIRIVP